MQSIEARCEVENEDVAWAAPTGDAPTTSEWPTILLPTKVQLILEVLQYFMLDNGVCGLVSIALAIMLVPCYTAGILCNQFVDRVPGY